MSAGGETAQALFEALPGRARGDGGGAASVRPVRPSAALSLCAARAAAEPQRARRRRARRGRATSRPTAGCAAAVSRCSSAARLHRALLGRQKAGRAAAARAGRKPPAARAISTSAAATPPPREDEQRAPGDRGELPAHAPRYLREMGPRRRGRAGILARPRRTRLETRTKHAALARSTASPAATWKRLAAERTPAPRAARGRSPRAAGRSPAASATPASPNWQREEAPAGTRSKPRGRKPSPPLRGDRRAPGRGRARAFPLGTSASSRPGRRPPRFPADLKFAQLRRGGRWRSPKSLPRDPRLALPGPAQFPLPLALTFPQQGSLLFETQESGGPRSSARSTTSSCACSPPRRRASSPSRSSTRSASGRISPGSCTSPITRRASSTAASGRSASQIEERLAELNEHIEKVIQMYLRNEYATITEYNEQAGSVAEKYHFLVVADFPGELQRDRRASACKASPPAARAAASSRSSTGTSASRCRMASCRMNCARAASCSRARARPIHRSASAPRRRRALVLRRAARAGTRRRSSSTRSARRSIDSNRVEVPFSQIAPAAGRALDERDHQRTARRRSAAPARPNSSISPSAKARASTRSSRARRVPANPRSSTSSSRISRSACSPEQVEFYLIDFKKGVEFKCYAEQAPAARPRRRHRERPRIRP